MKKSTNDAIKWLNRNARKYPGPYPDDFKWFEVDYKFDYPDYAGLPKSISSKLTSDAVDAIQESWPVGKWDGRQFRKEITLVIKQGYNA